jgi:hypothetical protein
VNERKGWRLGPNSHQPHQQNPNGQQHSQQHLELGEYIPRRELSDPRDQEESVIPRLEKMISEAITNLPAQIVPYLGEKEDQKEEEKITFRRSKNTEKFWDRRKRGGYSPYGQTAEDVEGGLMRDSNRKGENLTPELEDHQKYIKYSRYKNKKN